jgi:hypothetical protein
MGFSMLSLSLASPTDDDADDVLDETEGPRTNE